ncbi:MAG: HEAT repeat domain-containing protein [Planctomycetota bacterium]
MFLQLILSAAAAVVLIQDKPKTPKKPANNPPQAPLEGELPRDTNVLLAYAKSENVGLRRKAVEGLKAMGADAKEAISILTKLVHDDSDAGVRRLSAEALAEMGPLASGAQVNLSKGLFDKDPGVQKACALALGQIGPRAFTSFDSLLKTVRQYKDTELQTAAANSAMLILSKVKEDAPRKAAMLKVIDALGDPSEDVREILLKSLASIGRAARDAEAKIRELSEKDASPKVKSAAAETLNKLYEEKSDDAAGDSGAQPSKSGTLQFASFDAVLAGLKSNKTTVRREAVEKLTSMKVAAAPAVVPLKKLLREDEDVFVRIGAARALGAIGSAAEAAVKELGLTLTTKTEDERVRAASADALGLIGPRAVAAFPALTRAWVEDEYGIVRKAAANSLFTKMEAPAATVATQIKDILLTSKEEDVRTRAADSLAQLGAAAKDTIPVIARSLKDEAAIVRRAAAVALGEFGADAKLTVPQLLDSLKDGDASVRKLAENSIRKIDPAAVPAELAIVIKKPDEPAPAEPAASQPVKPETQPAPEEPKPNVIKTLAEQVAELIDNEAGMSRPTAIVADGKVQLNLQLEHPRFDEAMAHTDAVRLSLKLIDNITDLESLTVSILHHNGRVLSTKTVTAERAKPFIAIDDPFERRRMRDWWDQIAK